MSTAIYQKRNLSAFADIHDHFPSLCAYLSFDLVFVQVPDPMMRYKQLLYFAKKLKPLPEELHTPENKVEGCVSQVTVAMD